jgi:type IV secretory pathway TraG/TraD family ATPase VirD4
VNWTHGTTGLLISFGLCVAGLVIGARLGRAAAPRFALLLTFSIVIFIVAVMLWTALAGVLKGIGIPSAVIPYLGVLFIAAFSVVVGKVGATLSASQKHKRGTMLDAPAPGFSPSPPPGARKPPPHQGLTLAGLPVPESDETKHFKIIGTTGTGKSTAMRELLGGALERGDRMVIADPDGSYLNAFYNPARGDLILSPFDPRAARWDLFGEMNTLHDAEQLARSLIPDGEDAEGAWRNYGRIFLTAVLRQLHRVRHDDVGELYRLLVTTPVEDLRDLLADTAAGPYLAQDNGRFFGSVRAVVTTHLSALEHIALQTSQQSLSVREWIRRGRGGGGILFLPYRANEIATLRGLISTWLRLAIFETMSQPEGDQGIWFAIDEVDALGRIDGLKDALARLRKFGGRCVIGLQSIAQMGGNFGHAEAQTIVENCGNTLILRSSSSDGGGTARFASDLIGEREIIRTDVTKTRRPTEILATRSVADHHITESAVLASEIEQLPDLQGFLKFASQPNWNRVTLSPTWARR